jgi:hypothetical protein
LLACFCALAFQNHDSYLTKYSESSFTFGIFAGVAIVAILKEGDKKKTLT